MSQQLQMMVCPSTFAGLAKKTLSAELVQPRHVVRRIVSLSADCSVMGSQAQVTRKRTKNTSDTGHLLTLASVDLWPRG